MVFSRGIYRTISLQTGNNTSFYPLITIQLQSANITTIVTIKKYLTTPLSVATKHFQVNEAYISKLC